MKITMNQTVGYFGNFNCNFNVTKISRQKVLEYITTVPALEQYFKKGIVALVSVQDGKIMTKFLKCLQNLKQLYLIKANVSKDFFKELSMKTKKLEGLSLNACRLGNQLPKHIQNLPLETLQRIIIISDRVSSRGLKTLMKIQMPCLQGIKIWNTDVTLDGLKLFKRRPQNTCLTISYYQHNVYSDNLLFKTIVDAPLNKEVFMFQSCNLQKPNLMDTFHFGYLAKYPRQNSSELLIIFNFWYPYEREWTEKRNVECLKKGIQIAFHH